jgi:hypothetical protein
MKNLWKILLIALPLMAVSTISFAGCTNKQIILHNKTNTALSYSFEASGINYNHQQNPNVAPNSDCTIGTMTTDLVGYTVSVTLSTGGTYTYSGTFENYIGACENQKLAAACTSTTNCNFNVEVESDGHSDAWVNVQSNN